MKGQGSIRLAEVWYMYFIIFLMLIPAVIYFNEQILQDLGYKAGVLDDPSSPQFHNILSQLDSFVLKLWILYLLSVPGIVLALRGFWKRSGLQENVKIMVLFALIFISLLPLTAILIISLVVSAVPVNTDTASASDMIIAMGMAITFLITVTLQLVLVILTSLVVVLIVLQGIYSHFKLKVSPQTRRMFIITSFLVFVFGAAAMILSENYSNLKEILLVMTAMIGLVLIEIAIKMEKTQTSQEFKEKAQQTREAYREEKPPTPEQPRVKKGYRVGPHNKIVITGEYAREVLGVKQGDSFDDIHRKFINITRKLHADANSESSDVVRRKLEETLQEVNDAWSYYEENKNAR
ncbi:MAG: hypothetical protein NTU61_06235 [Candidatus Altiarchaeota archaeon]|nr:hypothetical protein [Candidatus Altiarchaeota archaeon]